MLTGAAILPVITALCAVGGSVLLIRGRRGRLIDEMPHCRKCGYNLTELVSNVCPECGIALTPEQVVHGLRRRRPGAIAFGLVLLLIAGALMINLVRSAAKGQWYPYYPLSWVLADAEAGKARGTNELSRRLQQNALSDSAMRRIVQSVLDKQGKRSYPLRFQEVVDLVGFLDAAGKLTASEQNRLYEQIGNYAVQCPARIPLGNPLPITVTVKLCGPASIWSETKLFDEISVDGKAVPFCTDGGAICGSSGASSSLSRNIDSLNMPPGRHRVELDFTVNLFRRRSSDFEQFLGAGSSGALLGDPAWKDALTSLANTLKTVPNTISDPPIWTKVMTISVNVEATPPDVGGASPAG